MIYKNIDLHASVFCNVSEDMAKEYIDYRIQKKKPLTQGAFNRAVNQAAKCVCSPDEAIQLTIDKGWDGVTPEYIQVELNRRVEAVEGKKDERCSVVIGSVNRKLGHAEATRAAAQRALQRIDSQAGNPNLYADG
jgi:hypothetical protein